ncbi:gp222 [Bacillus phage W.Ph.]|uniref:Gp222 n=1 Tax=Bacillus phage W.Ph. TaxID=764595 RepID=G9B1X3_9CAUD|nr:gp222 [Bacillus phage W.Ph.]ADH03368.1 gp222 [Bacillus phage W.Ph.]
MKKEFTCKHNESDRNEDLLRLKISKKGKLIIKMGNVNLGRLTKVKLTKKEAQELQDCMGDTLNTGYCRVVDKEDKYYIDVDLLNCFGENHYFFGVEVSESFESVHLSKEDFEELYTQIRHFSMEGELL